MIKSYKSANNKIVPAENVAEGGWTRLTQPDDIEISTIAKALNVDVADVRASLDKEEGSRIEYENNNSIMIIDIPYMTETGTPYNTIPFAIISSDNNIITVCQMNSPIIDKFIEISTCDLNDKTEFILKLMYAISIEYQQDLRNINNRRREIEKNLDKNSKNQDIIELHRLESSLVYFITSLRACNVVLEKIRRYREDKMDRRHLDLLHDVIIENKQAIEMATTYREVIDGTRDLFVAVSNNKLNYVMEWLTAVTIILSIPMIISGMYGMNVNLPMSENIWAFWFIITGTILICACVAFWIRKRFF